MCLSSRLFSKQLMGITYIKTAFMLYIQAMETVHICWLLGSFFVSRFSTVNWLKIDCFSRSCRRNRRTFRHWKLSSVKGRLIPTPELALVFWHARLGVRNAKHGQQSLQSGRFWAISIALFRERFSDFKPCCSIVLNNVTWGRPSGLLQSSGRDAVKILLASTLLAFVQCAQTGRDAVIALWPRYGIVAWLVLALVYS